MLCSWLLKLVRTSLSSEGNIALLQHVEAYVIEVMCGSSFESMEASHGHTDLMIMTSIFQIT